MTTIAIKGGIIAYDSRCMSNDTIVSNNHCKHGHEKGVHFFFSGNICDERLLMDLYFNREVSMPFSHFSINALAVDGGNVFKLGVCKETGLWRCPIRHPEALGSGTDHALTAMDMGATAKEAVKWAMKRDSGTGGRIRTFRIKRG